MNRYRIYCCRLRPEGTYVQTVFSESASDAMKFARMIALAPMVEKVGGKGALQ